MVNEVAARLKVAPGTVRNMIEEGQLYAVRRLVVPTWALEDLARPTHAPNVTLSTGPPAMDYYLGHGEARGRWVGSLHPRLPTPAQNVNDVAGHL
ncbi:MAG TPA: helix-turn-helix domain-containing protein [Acidimicrobiales bacterium]|nr:helix-turn-helix domain-containing protein [Acidimicrobiales bacterium]